MDNGERIVLLGLIETSDTFMKIAFSERERESESDFQQYSAPYRRACIITDWFQEHD